MSDALFRLIGDGDRHSGGAIPLPDAFAAVLNELIDHGNADHRRLNTLISDALIYKEERVMSAAWRSWPAFTSDILAVLQEMNLIRENQFSRWELTNEFVSGHMFYLPNTDIGFTGRSQEERDRWEANSLLHMALNPVIITLKEKAGKATPLVIKLLEEAERVLVGELKLDQPPDHKPTRYRQRQPRKPHEEGKKLRSGMTKFFRRFWDEFAEDGRWYDLAEIGRKFEEVYPDQPRISHSGDLLGSMRKVGRDMVNEGVLESQRVMGDGSWKNVFRKKTSSGQVPGYSANAAVVPVVTWEGLKGDPKA